MDQESKEILEDIMEDLEKESAEKAAAAEEASGEKKEDTAQSAEETAAQDTAEGDASETADAEEEGKKKSFFGKKDKNDPLKDKINELQDKYTRQIAEFDNFRKRTEREKSQMFDAGASHVLEKILPIVDNFERGLATVPEEEKDGAFADGMNKIYKQLVKQLEDLGVTPIEAVGKEFDPNLHNAVMQADSDEVESGYVVQELLKGYMYHDTVLRHSMVSVAK